PRARAGPCPWRRGQRAPATERAGRRGALATGRVGLPAGGAALGLVERTRLAPRSVRRAHDPRPARRVATGGRDVGQHGSEVAGRPALPESTDGRLMGADAEVRDHDDDRAALPDEAFVTALATLPRMGP